MSLINPNVYSQSIYSWENDLPASNDPFAEFPSDPVYIDWTGAGHPNGWEDGFDVMSTQPLRQNQSNALPSGVPLQAIEGIPMRSNDCPIQDKGADVVFEKPATMGLIKKRKRTRKGRVVEVDDDTYNLPSVTDLEMNTLTYPDGTLKYPNRTAIEQHVINNIGLQAYVAPSEEDERRRTEGANIRERFSGDPIPIGEEEFTPNRRRGIPRAPEIPRPQVVGGAPVGGAPVRIAPVGGAPVRSPSISPMQTPSSSRRASVESDFSITEEELKEHRQRLRTLVNEDTSERVEADDVYYVLSILGDADNENVTWEENMLSVHLLENSTILAEAKGDALIALVDDPDIEPLINLAHNILAERRALRNERVIKVMHEEVKRGVMEQKFTKREVDYIEALYSLFALANFRQGQTGDGDLWMLRRLSVSRNNPYVNHQEGMEQKSPAQVSEYDQELEQKIEGKAIVEGEAKYLNLLEYEVELINSRGITAGEYVIGVEQKNYMDLRAKMAKGENLDPNDVFDWAVQIGRLAYILYGGNLVESARVNPAFTEAMNRREFIANYIEKDPEYGYDEPLSNFLHAETPDEMMLALNELIKM